MFELFVTNIEATTIDKPNRYYMPNHLMSGGSVLKQEHSGCFMHIRICKGLLVG